MSDSKKYVNVKISEDAKIAIQAIQMHHRPDMEMQEIYSLAIMEYLHAYYPQLEETVETLIQRRQEARRGDEEAHQP